MRTALQLLDRVCSLSKAEAMTAISAPLVRAGGVHWLRAIVRALEAAAAAEADQGDHEVDADVQLPKVERPLPHHARHHRPLLCACARRRTDNDDDGAASASPRAA